MQTPAAAAAAESALTQALGRLFAVAEAYPQLKANESFLQSRVRKTENGIVRITRSAATVTAAAEVANERLALH